MKYFAVVLVLYKTKYVDEPIDWPIYFITGALGFAALENAMFLIEPIALGESTQALTRGSLRFLGSTLLHCVTSGAIGIALGLSYFKPDFIKKVYLYTGLIFAVGLHSTFNFFIINSSDGNFLKTFSFLWVSAVIIMLLFEKLRRMGKYI